MGLGWWVWAMGGRDGGSRKGQHAAHGLSGVGPRQILPWNSRVLPALKSCFSGKTRDLCAVNWHCTHQQMFLKCILLSSSGLWLTGYRREPEISDGVWWTRVELSPPLV